MSKLKDTNSENEFWSKRYEEGRTGWDIGFPSTPLKTYIDQLENKDLKILIPGAGNAYEAEYLFTQGFKNVFVLDISKAPLDAFQKRNPEFPPKQLLLGNFFKQEEKYDLIFEQTFFCSFPPLENNRNLYAETMSQLLFPKGKLVGVWFDIPLTGNMEKRPFGGTREEYLGYLSPHFETVVFEKCYNSIEPRKGSELFGIFQKK
ncbi:MAG: methyltransferase domain-containing protein [Saprospiraceae bacterium]